MVGSSRQPEIRYPDPLPPVPERSASATLALADKQRAAFSGTGRAATMLTTGGGAAGASYAVKNLGGAGPT